MPISNPKQITVMQQKEIRELREKRETEGKLRLKPFAIRDNSSKLYIATFWDEKADRLITLATQRTNTRYGTLDAIANTIIDRIGFPVFTVLRTADILKKL